MMGAEGEEVRCFKYDGGDIKRKYDVELQRSWLLVAGQTIKSPFLTLHHFLTSYLMLYILCLMECKTSSKYHCRAINIVGNTSE